MIDMIDCGLTHQTNELVRDRIKLLAPDHASEIDGMSFGHIHEYVLLTYASVSIVEEPG
jgi:hypothetical protein